jgi:hypothetical protein
MDAAHDALPEQSARDMPEFELALLRRGVDRRSAILERCSRCHRTPLLGERVYAAEAGPILCELCRSPESDRPLRASVVHGPAFGTSMRILAA